MPTKTEMNLFKIIFLLTVFERFYCLDCDSKLNTCIHIVQPFLHLHQYMFPVNISDIQNVCKRWSELMECVRIFMNDCSTENQKIKFNDAVREPVHVVHAICSSEKYQREYLDIAECFKELSVNHCGTSYQRMIDRASDPRTKYHDICCGYREFQNCVNKPLQAKCGTRAHSLMDQFLAFLVSHCSSMANSLKEECRISISTHPPPRVQTVEVSTMREARHLPTRSWKPRTIIYPLEPTFQPQSRRSSSVMLKSTGISSGIAITVIIYRMMSVFG